MRPSPWSIGVVMIVLGAGSVVFAGTHGVSPTASSVAAAAALSIGGVALLLRRPLSFWIALAAALVTIGFAAASFLIHREVGLPLPPIVSLVLGIYIFVRVLLVKSALRPVPPAEPEED